MAKAMTDTVRDTLTTALREALENSEARPQPRKRRGRAAGATKLAAGAALAAAATRGADALRTPGSGPAHALSDLQRNVQAWTEAQKMKRGALDPEEHGGRE
jgi:hypothetical protein